MRVRVSYQIKVDIKNHHVSFRQRLGAWIIQLGVKVCDGKTSYKFEKVESESK